MRSTATHRPCCRFQHNIFIICPILLLLLLLLCFAFCSLLLLVLLLLFIVY
jgi:hypothetical protein